MGCIPLMHDDDRIRLWSDPSTVGDVDSSGKANAQWTSGPGLAGCGRRGPRGVVYGQLHHIIAHKKAF